MIDGEKGAFDLLKGEVSLMMLGNEKSAIKQPKLQKSMNLTARRKLRQECEGSGNTIRVFVNHSM